MPSASATQGSNAPRVYAHETTRITEDHVREARVPGAWRDEGSSRPAAPGPARAGVGETVGRAASTTRDTVERAANTTRNVAGRVATGASQAAADVGHTLGKGKEKVVHAVGSALEGPSTRLRQATAGDQVPGTGLLSNTAGSYRSYDIARIGTVTGLGTGLAALFATTTLLVPMSSLLLGTGGVCGAYWLYMSMYGDLPEAGDAPAQPFNAADNEQTFMDANTLAGGTTTVTETNTQVQTPLGIDALVEQLNNELLTRYQDLETERKALMELSQDVVRRVHAHGGVVDEEQIIEGEKANLGALAEKYNQGATALNAAIDRLRNPLVPDYERSLAEDKATVQQIYANLETAAKRHNDAAAARHAVQREVKMAEEAMKRRSATAVQLTGAFENLQKVPLLQLSQAKTAEQEVVRTERVHQTLTVASTAGAPRDYRRGAAAPAAL